jgi:hypothetical protein
VAQSAEAGHVRVADPGPAENGSERLSIELQGVARPRDRADVDDTIDMMGGEQTEELSDRPD